MMMVEDGFAQMTDCAFRVFTSVVSRANENRGILDAGSKTLTSDTGGLEGYGHITEHPGANNKVFRRTWISGSGKLQKKAHGRRYSYCNT